MANSMNVKTATDTNFGSEVLPSAKLTVVDALETPVPAEMKQVDAPPLVVSSAVLQPVDRTAASTSGKSCSKFGSKL